jgi:hypothetical protein
MRFLQTANAELGLEVVEVRGEDIPGMNARSHGFWYADPWVASDVILKLMTGAAAPARGLVPAEAAGLKLWRFPPDYEARLPGVLRAAFGISGESAPLPGSAAPVRP